MLPPFFNFDQNSSEQFNKLRITENGTAEDRIVTFFNQLFGTKQRSTVNDSLPSVTFRNSKSTKFQMCLFSKY